MEIENIHCENSSDIRLWDNYQASLLGDLKGQVFHLTSQHAFTLIQESGAVEHNKNKRFKLNSNSKKSFGRLMGWVCLFDLRNVTPAQIKDTIDNCYDFVCYPPGNLGSTEASEGCSKRALAYLILDSQYYEHLIPYQKYDEHVSKTGDYPLAIPKVETWIADKIPITWLEKVILANIGKPMSPHEIQISEVHKNFRIPPASH